MGAAQEAAVEAAVAVAVAAAGAAGIDTMIAEAIPVVVSVRGIKLPPADGNYSIPATQ
jgi:hypothetical protein